jgi:hypothetical protein
MLSWHFTTFPCTVIAIRYTTHSVSFSLHLLESKEQRPFLFFFEAGTTVRQGSFRTGTVTKGFLTVCSMPLRSRISSYHHHTFLCHDPRIRAAGPWTSCQSHSYTLDVFGKWSCHDFCPRLSIPRAVRTPSQVQMFRAVWCVTQLFCVAVYAAFLLLWYSLNMFSRKWERTTNRACKTEIAQYHFIGSQTYFRYPRTRPFRGIRIRRGKV